MSNWKEIIDIKKSAVIVIDMQNDFCHEKGASALNGRDVTNQQSIVPNIQRLIDDAHAAEIPVIFIKTTHDETTDSKVWLSRLKSREHGICATGSWGAEYYGVKPTEKDIEVIKHRYSAFIGTDLELRLRSMGVENLLITGVGVNVCVESTMRHGFMLDFFTLLVTDGTAASSKENYDMSVAICGRHFGWTTDTNELSSLLR